MAIIVSEKLRNVVPRDLEEALTHIERLSRLIAMAAESGENPETMLSVRDFAAIKEAAWHVSTLAEAAIDLVGNDQNRPWDIDTPEAVARQPS